MTNPKQYPQFRIPPEDGQTLCVPPWNSAKEVVFRNRDGRQKTSIDVLGTPLAEFVRTAKAEVLAAALEYTQSYADITLDIGADCPFVLTGHQPGLAHPGVWLKNFSASQLAEATDGVAISLVIDSDLCRSPSVRVPAGSVDQPRKETVPFDLACEQVPFEQRKILDHTVWQSFGSRVSEAIAPLVADPLIHSWWPDVIAATDENTLLGEALSQSRHRLELAWDCRSLEIPQSRVCQTRSFRQFAVHLLTEATRFRTCHNRALNDYRLAHHLRNHAQPVPDLAESSDWQETPFWIWSQQDPRRRAVWVRRHPEGLQITDRAEMQDVLPISSEGDPAAAVNRLGEWENQGLKLRTRALVTTMFARLFLSDLFIHGIGGAKYDQVTDDICRHFFGIEPPQYLTLSGTLCLPISSEPVSWSQEKQLYSELRDLRYHPEKHVAELALDSPEEDRMDALTRQKKDWVHTEKTPSNAAKRHRQIVAANQGLQRWTKTKRETLKQQLQSTQRKLRAQQLLRSREYPFCLFPHDALRNFFLDFSSSIA